MSTVAQDLLAALSEGVQAAGPSEVDKLSPASTRGIPEGRGSAGRRQIAYVRVDTAPPWPTAWDTTNPWPTWDAWRAEVARRQDEKDQLCGAASVVKTMDSDEAEDLQAAEQKRVHVLCRVVDADGIEWVDCPEWELDDLPQPVNVIAREERPVVPRKAPILKLAEVTAPTDAEPVKKKVGQPPKMTPEQIDAVCRRIDGGEHLWTIAKQEWERYGFSSPRSFDVSIRRQRKLRAEAQALEVAA